MATQPRALFHCVRTIPEIRRLDFALLHDGMRTFHQYLEDGKKVPTTVVNEQRLQEIAGMLQWPTIDPEGHSAFLQTGALSGLVKLMAFVVEQVYCIFYKGYVSGGAFEGNRSRTKPLGEELRDCVLLAGQGCLTIQKERQKTIQAHCGSESPPAFDVMSVAREFNIDSVPGDMTAAQLCEILRNLSYVPGGGSGAGGSGAAAAFGSIQQTPLHALSRSATATIFPPPAGLGHAQRLDRGEISRLTEVQGLGPPARLPRAILPATASTDTIRERVEQAAAALRETREALNSVMDKLAATK